MKITSEMRVIRNSYMRARSENDKPEMSRLKAKAKTMMNTEKIDSKTIINEQPLTDSNVIKNKDGDTLEISLPAKKLNSISSKSE